MSAAGSQSHATIEAEQVGDIVVLRPVGRIDSNNAAQAEEIVIGHVQGGAQRLLLDMGELEYISSAGLRVLLVTAKKLKQSGGRFALCNLRANVHEVLEVSGFLAILAVSDSREAAIASLGAS